MPSNHAWAPQPAGSAESHRRPATDGDLPSWVTDELPPPPPSHWPTRQPRLAGQGEARADARRPNTPAAAMPSSPATPCGPRAAQGLNADVAAASAPPHRHQLPVIKKMGPGQPGTKRWVREYGADLVCVRYRHDPSKDERLITVELAVQRAPLRQRSSVTGCDTVVENDNDNDSDNDSDDGNTNTESVAVLIKWNETDLRREAFRQGARWDGRQRLWRMTRGAAKTLRLIDRIVNCTI